MGYIRRYATLPLMALLVMLCSCTDAEVLRFENDSKIIIKAIESAGTKRQLMGAKAELAKLYIKYKDSPARLHKSERDIVRQTMVTLYTAFEIRKAQLDGRPLSEAGISMYRIRYEQYINQFLDESTTLGGFISKCIRDEHKE